MDLGDSIRLEKLRNKIWFCTYIKLYIKQCDVFVRNLIYAMMEMVLARTAPSPTFPPSSILAAIVKTVGFSSSKQLCET